MPRAFNMSKTQIEEMVSFTALADREARSDLALGYIANENDYTSNFTGALRRIINSNSKTGLEAKSFVLKGGDEQRLGCDAAIIIKSNDDCKISIFEAKWPRIMQKNYQWDYQQKSANGASSSSHFTNQLDKQARVPKKVAIFEMFYCEATFNSQPAYMDSSGSSCTWHDETLRFNNRRPNRDANWNKNDLSMLLQQNSKSISEIIYEICICNKGEPTLSFDLEEMYHEFVLPDNILLISEQHE